MEQNTPNLEAIHQQREGMAPVRDRLITTLFLAALLHVIVITGITFVADNNKTDVAPTLEAVLLNEQVTNDQKNPDAVYIAQQNQTGVGNTQKKLPAANTKETPQTKTEDSPKTGHANQQSKPQSESTADQVLANLNDQAEKPLQHSDDASQQGDAKRLSLSSPAARALITSTTATTLTLRGKLTREAFITPDTQESRIAPYLEYWKRKIERIGTLNYPYAARGPNRKGNPIVEVTITANGQLKKSVLQQSSGNPSVDQAALDILRHAAPFAPFPKDLKKDYDQLRFAYEWQFIVNSQDD